MDASVVFDIHFNDQSFVWEDYVSRSLEVIDCVLPEQMGLGLAMSVLFP